MIKIFMDLLFLATSLFFIILVIFVLELPKLPWTLFYLDQNFPPKICLSFHLIQTQIVLLMYFKIISLYFPHLMFWLFTFPSQPHTCSDHSLWHFFSHAGEDEVGTSKWGKKWELTRAKFRKFGKSFFAKAYPRPFWRLWTASRVPGITKCILRNILNSEDRYR